MNEMIEKIMTRHAIRQFQDKQVEEDILDQILQAGLYAPSAGNNQYSRIVVCQDKAINQALGKISRWMQFKGKDPKGIAHSVSSDQPSIMDDFSIMDGFYGAPTVLHLFTRKGPYNHDDAVFMAENMWLAAHFLDIGACYIGRAQETFNTEYGSDLKKQWSIPEDMEAVGHLILGYREGPLPKDKPRKEGRIIRL